MKATPTPFHALRSTICLLAAGILGTTSVVSPAQSATERNPELQKIEAQIAERLIATTAPKDARFMGNTGPTGAKAWMETITADGNWADIEYEGKSGGAWPPQLHLARVVDMAKAYANPESPLHHDAALKKAIQQALAHWFAKNYKSPNWFHNEIRLPQSMGYILILMGNELTPEERTEGMKLLAQSSIKMTGQNQVWLSANVLMRAVLENNYGLAKKASEAIASNAGITTAEGLQPDFSYHQHGAQLQSGAYGLDFAREIIAALQSLRGTSLAFTPEKTAILRNYLLKGLGWVDWKGQLDISVCGRALFPGNTGIKSDEVSLFLKAMAAGDAEHAKEYRQLLAANEPGSAPNPKVAGNVMYWRSDYVADRRADYLATVKMSSKRVIGTETVNKENLLGYYLPDGATYVYRTGNEYRDIFPVWNWYRLPGTTACQRGRIFPLGGEKWRNMQPFVGGISDGSVGAAAMDSVRKEIISKQPGGIVLKKSWFFFPGQFVCLGAGITSDANQMMVFTTLNQCLLNGPVSASTGDALIPVPQRQEIANLQWIWHDQVGYFFPTPVTATVGSEKQTGSWDKVFAAGSADPVEKNVFAAWISHGLNPKDASYAYIVLPGITEAGLQEYAKKPEAKVLKNTPELQAVSSGETTIAIFYSPGELEYAPGKSLKLDQSGLVMLQTTSKGPVVRVSDPTQELTELTLTLNGKTTTVKLPAGPEAGSTLEVALK